MAIYPVFSRRTALMTLGAAVLAPRALAAPKITWPLRVAYARVSPGGGFVHIRTDEQTYWDSLVTRLGGLIETLAPLQPGDMLGGASMGRDAPDGAAAARQRAEAAGFSHIILYATQDGQRRRETDDPWFARTFSTLRGKGGRATGEAHLLDVADGATLASAHADAAPRDPLNLFDGNRNPEREALTGLVQALERRLTEIARPAYENERSIAD